MFGIGFIELAILAGVLIAGTVVMYFVLNQPKK